MKITNKRAFYDFEILDKLEAGINLNGGEVKAVKNGRADLTGSFVRIVGSEAYLVNSRVYPQQPAEGYDARRTRKLLLHKKEILALKTKSQGQGLTIVPLSLYTSPTGLVKLEIAQAKGKRKFDKRRRKR